MNAVTSATRSSIRSKSSSGVVSGGLNFRTLPSMPPNWQSRPWSTAQPHASAHAAVAAVLRSAVEHVVDPDEQPGAAHVADDLEAPGELPEARGRAGAEVAGALDQPLVLDDVQDGHARGGRERLVHEREDVPGLGLDLLGDQPVTGDERTHRHAAADPLAGDEQVRPDVEQLACPHRAAAGHARLDLVDDQQHTALAAGALDLAVVPGREDDVPAGALDDLHDERGDLPVAAVQRVLERADRRPPRIRPVAEGVAVGVGVGDLPERRPTHRAGEPGTVGRDPGQAHRGQRHPVVGAVQRQDLGAAGHAHRQLHGRLDRVAAAGEQGGLGQPRWRHPRQARAVGDHGIALVQDVRRRQPCHLLGHRGRDARVRVADHRRPGGARHGVKVLAPVGVPEARVVATHEDHTAVALQRMQHEAVRGRREIRRVHVALVRFAARGRRRSRPSRRARHGHRRSRW
jgi:hypothetical protein